MSSTPDSGRSATAALERVAVVVADPVLGAEELVGLLAQRFFGLWWVDGVASLVIVAFLLREAREAWEGNH